MVEESSYSIDYQYFGSIDYIFNLINYTDLVFLSAVMHDKAQHLNRTWLNGPNNLVGLSIPLKGGRNVRQPVRDIQVAEDRNWKRIHWRTIHDCYRKSPWFDEYSDGLRLLYERDQKFLIDWCFDSCQWSLQTLMKKSDILTEKSVSSKTIQLAFEREPQLQVSEVYPTYQQVFSDKHGFIANLSILDLLLNEGPHSFFYLQKLTACKKTSLNHR